MTGKIVRSNVGDMMGVVVYAENIVTSFGLWV